MDRGSRSAADWALVVGLVVEALLVASVGVLNSLWVSTFTQFEGSSALGPTFKWAATAGLFLVVIVWGLFGVLGIHSARDWKGWRRLGIFAVGIVNLLGFVIVAIDLVIGPKFERLDYLQNLLGMVITSVVTTTAFLLIRRWSSLGSPGHSRTSL